MRIASALLPGLVVAACLVVARPAHADEAPRLAAGGALVLSPAGTVQFITDSHGPADRLTQGLGLEGEALLPVSSRVQVGLGARYSLTLLAEDGPRRQEHLISIPLLITGSLKFNSDRALELRAGVGYGLTLYPDHDHATASGAPLLARGTTMELTIGYVRPYSPGLLATTHLGVQWARLRTINGESYWSDAYGDSGAIVLSFGVRRR